MLLVDEQLYFTFVVCDFVLGKTCVLKRVLHLRC
jgi:hypothetical protein